MNPQTILDSHAVPLTKQIVEARGRELDIEFVDSTTFNNQRKVGYTDNRFHYPSVLSCLVLLSHHLEQEGWQDRFFVLGPHASAPRPCIVWRVDTFCSCFSCFLWSLPSWFMFITQHLFLALRSASTTVSPLSSSKYKKMTAEAGVVHWRN